ncbi:hypothetical protein E4T48_02141 [Aureobasidium sp. EXF-10727]|nr:hypothetical protein E4T48_02141 [Aureobasidium sp. EXF-10727]
MSGTTLPLSPVTSTDHRGWLWITVITCTIVCPLLLLGRVIVRYRKYGLDDLAVVLSFVFVMAHSALLMGSLELGLGVLLAPDTQSTILKAAKLVFASRILLSLVLGASKLSALLLLRRLLPTHCVRTYVCNTGILLVVVWGVMAILTTNADCEPSGVLLEAKASGCQHLDTRISITMALSCATELGVVSLAAAFSNHMQVEQQQRKWVVVAFMLRMPNIALSIAYLISYLHFLSSGHSSISFIPVAILQQVLCCYSFFASVSTAFFPFTIPTTISSSPYSSNSSMKTLSRRRMSTPMSFFGDKIRGDREVFSHRARVFADVKGVQRRESERKIRQHRQREKGHVKSVGSQESLKGIVREETFEVQVV